MAATAATAANSMAHQIPSMAIPPMPRIRPPRMLKGLPHPNQNPPPSDAAPEISNAVWVQGKWRSRPSNAVRHKISTQNLQAAKALRHETHGLNIYAYRHIRTNQVVYSLARTLQNTKILKQLVFHGKKTVPASVRRDMWTPYFSIHFPSTPAGALEGLFAYQKLRELSLQRQLSPPDSLIRVTQEDIDIVKYKLGSPVQLQELAARNQLTGKIPRLNEILPKKLQGRRLMDQKASSVADAAFVLDWITSGPSQWEKLKKVEGDRVLRRKEMTTRNLRRMRKVREGEAKRKEEILKRAAMALKDIDPEDRFHLPLSRQALEQLSVDHHGVVGQRRLLDVDQMAELKSTVESWESREQQPLPRAHLAQMTARQLEAKGIEDEAIKQWFETHETPTTESDSVWQKVAGERTAARADLDGNTEGQDGEKPEWADAREIKMYWADLNDGLFAKSWPRTVIHGNLAPFGISRTQERVVSKTVHVIGSDIDDGWMPAELATGQMIPPVWTPPPQEREQSGQYLGQDIATATVEETATTDAARQEFEETMVEPKPQSLWGRFRGMFGR